MSPDRNGAPLFGRRQLLLGGGTFLAGVVGVAAWTKTHSGNGDGSTPPPPSTSPPPSSSPQTEVISVQAVLPVQPTNATELTPTTTVSVAETTSEVASTLAQAATGPATYVNHGPPDVNAVALTFHLGGDPTLVGELLDLLKTSGITSTLFAIGDWLTANATLGHRAVDDGHELGNHTKSHMSMMKLSRADVSAEIVGGGQALIPFIGSIGRWFRPSGTDVPSDVILEEAGLAGYAVSVGYDIDPRDYTEPGVAAVIARVKKGLHPGAIVSLHFGHRDTIDALPQILDLLSGAGLTPVTMTGLLG
jgi:peptidoglycan/xylan/chitin deacetylase (PgdA/CDA1 family)